MLRPQLKWHQQFREGELNQILELIESLKLLGFFDAVAIDLQDGVIARIIGIPEDAAVKEIVGLQAQIALLKRLVTESGDLVKATNSDNFGE